MEYDYNYFDYILYAKNDDKEVLLNKLKECYNKSESFDESWVINCFFCFLSVSDSDIILFCKMGVGCSYVIPDNKLNNSLFIH